jgi:hypothetical protein
MAKQIEPLTIWVNGVSKVAEYLKVTGIFDNYESAARNEWELFTKVVDAEGNDVPGEQLSKGNLDINGQDYINWGDQPAMAINAWIYDWVAEQLNLTII